MAAATAMNSSVPTMYTRAGNVSPDGSLAPVAEAVVFQYGTAGFRTKDEFMPFIAFRTAVYASQRAS